MILRIFSKTSFYLIINPRIKTFYEFNIEIDIYISKTVICYNMKNQCTTAKIEIYVLKESRYNDDTQ